MFHTKRVYDPPAKSDGKRYLVERLWPRGMKKEALRMDGWLKDVAPSADLRRWFAHDPAKWNEFQKRYRAELDQNPQGCRSLVEAARNGEVTLLFSSRDPANNNAIALQDYLAALPH